MLATMLRRMSWVLVLAGCGQVDDAADDSGDGSTSQAATSKADVPPILTTSDSDPTTGGDATAGGGDATTSEGSADSGSAECTKNVVLMGYWPPTNEMLRRYSDNPLQNPGAWEGEDWEGYGYDVYAFFPEFPPDGDPTNDDIGDDGAVGSPRFDLRVDYQATSEDFWRIVDDVQPVIVLTTSRGGETDWEIEAIEGGHGTDNFGDPAFDWSSDRHGPDTRPFQDTVQSRSWDAMTSYRQGTTIDSMLPIDDIFAATSALGIGEVEIDTNGTSGNFLSGFLGLHGIYYASITDHAVAGGHIHVGFGLPTETAETFVETTLHAILQAHPFDATPCP
jgi:hypothetical protein